MLANHQLVNQTSGKTEWYTPKEIIEAARATMGGIDLDPASCESANRIVKATTYYTAPDFTVVDEINGLPVRLYADWGGLARPFFGRMFQNHPFGNPENACSPDCKKKTCEKRGWHTATDLPGNSDWIQADIAAYRSGRLEQACILTFAAMSETWFRPLLDYPMVHFYGRVQYIDPDTGQPAGGVTKGSCLTYLGEYVDGFAKMFHYLGAVHVPYHLMRGRENYVR